MEQTSPASRRRAELLASLSPEGRATYEVLRAHLARDLDRRFAESEEAVETALGDLHTKLDGTIADLRWNRRVNGERAKEIVAATWSEASTTDGAAASVLAATTANTSTPATVSAPSVAALDSTSPRVQAVTATAPTAPAVSVDLSLKRDIDHLVGGSTTPASNPSDVITAATASWVAASVGAATASAPSTMSPAAEALYQLKMGSWNPASTSSSVPATPDSDPAVVLVSALGISPITKPPVTCSVICPGGDMSSPLAMSTSTASPPMVETPTSCLMNCLGGDTSVALLKYFINPYLLLQHEAWLAQFKSESKTSRDELLAATKETNSTALLTIRILFQCVTGCGFLTLPWDPGQRAIDSSAIICGRELWNAWSQFPSCSDRRILLRKRVMYRKYSHPSITGMISYQETSYANLQLHIFPRHSELVTSLGIAWVTCFLDFSEILGLDFEALALLSIVSQLKYICTTDQWKIAWFSLGYNHCQWHRQLRSTLEISWLFIKVFSVVALWPQSSGEKIYKMFRFLHYSAILSQPMFNKDCQGEYLLIFHMAGTSMSKVMRLILGKGACYVRVLLELSWFNTDCVFPCWRDQSDESLVRMQRPSQDIGMDKFIKPIYSQGSAWERQHIRWLSFLLIPTEMKLIRVLDRRHHEQLKHASDYRTIQVLRPPWPPPMQEGLHNLVAESNCSLKCNLMVVIDGLFSAVRHSDGVNIFRQPLSEAMLRVHSYSSEIVVDGFLQAWYLSCLSTDDIHRDSELMQWKIPWLIGNPLLWDWPQFCPNGYAPSSSEKVQDEIAWSFDMAYFDIDNLERAALICYLVIEQFEWKVTWPPSFPGSIHVSRVELVPCSVHTAEAYNFQCEVFTRLNDRSAMGNPGDCFVSVWRHENLASTHDVCPGPGIATLQVTWDPGGSTQYQAEDWVQEVLQTPWDPGDTMQHRLGGKSNLMGEGLSATCVRLDSGPSPWAWPALTVAKRSPTNSRKTWKQRRLGPDGGLDR